MKKLYFLLIIFTSLTINSQVVFDFQNDQDLGGWFLVEEVLPMPI